ncbi:MAG: hypothetical protein Q9224_000677 [Gallowayella concinna]
MDLVMPTMTATATEITGISNIVWGLDYHVVDPDGSWRGTREQPASGRLSADCMQLPGMGGGRADCGVWSTLDWPKLDDLKASPVMLFPGHGRVVDD